MAGTRSLGRLTLDLIAKVGGFETGMDRAARVADRRLKQIRRQAEITSRETARAISSAITRPLLALGAAFSAQAITRGIIASADSYQLLQGRLKLVTSSSEELAKVNKDLFAVSQRTRSPLQGVTDLYIRLAGVSKELGINQEQLIGFTEAVGNALTLSGTSAEGASGALLQLSQAIGGGIVRAEEFNSILEGAPVIIQTVAKNLDGAGGSVSKLRNLVNDGKVSSRAFFDAFQAGAAELATKAQSIPRTVGQAITQLRNEFSRSVGTSDTSPLIKAIDDLREKVADPEFQRRLVETANNIVQVVAALSSLGAKTIGAVNGVMDAVASKQKSDEIADMAMRARALQREIHELENGGGILRAFGRDPEAELASVRAEFDKTTASIRAYAQAAVASAVPSLPQISGPSIAIPLRPGGPAAKPPPKPIDPDAKKEAERRAKAIQDYINKLREESVALGMTVPQIKAREIALLGATSAQQQQVYELAKYIELQQKDIDDAAERARIFEQTRTPAEKYAATIQRLNELFEYGKKDKETYVRAVAEAQDAFVSATQSAERALDEMSVYAEQAARNIQDIFADFLFDPFEKGLSGMLADFATMLQRMAAQAAAQKILGALMGLGSGSLLDSILSIGGGLGGNTPIDGTLAKGGPVLPGHTYLVGEKGMELFTPRVAGTIVPNDKLGGGTINITIPVSAPTGTVGQQTLAQIQAAAYAGAQMAASRNR